MKHLHISAAVLALFLFGQCKLECSGLSDATVSLDQTEVNSLAYQGGDSVWFEENSVLKLFRSNTPRQYYNSQTPNSDCDATLKLEGSELIFTDSTQQPKIYHNQSVSANDTSTSQFHITYQNRTFLFTYTNLTQSISQLPFTINGKTYQNVLKLKSSNDSIYYNRTNGIIRIKLQSGYLLQLH